MRRLRLIGATLLGCALIALTPASAIALSPVIKDCANSSSTSLTGHYTIVQLRQALNSMPATTAEYGNCAQMIMDQILLQENKPLKGGGSGGGNSGGGSSSTLLVIVIVVVVVVALAGGGFLFSRRRTGGGDSEEPPPPGAS